MKCSTFQWHLVSVLMMFSEIENLFQMTKHIHSSPWSPLRLHSEDLHTQLLFVQSQKLQANASYKNSQSFYSALHANNWPPTSPAHSWTSGFENCVFSGKKWSYFHPSNLTKFQAFQWNWLESIYLEYREPEVISFRLLWNPRRCTERFSHLLRDESFMR